MPPGQSPGRLQVNEFMMSLYKISRPQLPVASSNIMYYKPGTQDDRRCNIGQCSEKGPCRRRSRFAANSLVQGQGAVLYRGPCT